MAGFFKKLSPARIIALGFAAVILLGSALLMLPCSLRGGIPIVIILLFVHLYFCFLIYYKYNIYVKNPHPKEGGDLELGNDYFQVKHER